MKISIGSDLHLDTYFASKPGLIRRNGSTLHIDLFNNNENSDVLILAGDIAEAKQYKFMSPILKKISVYYPLTFIVLGNHEFYHSSLKKTNGIIKKVLADNNITNIIVLDNDVYEHMGIKFIGSTLWSNFNGGNPISKFTCKYTMNDFKVIQYNLHGCYRKVTPDDIEKIFINNKQFIFNEIDNVSDSKLCIVITHHLPSNQSNSERYRQSPDGWHINGAYATELGYDIVERDNIALWVHGHTHDPADYMLGSCRVICNPLGYNGMADQENYSFLTVEVN